MIRDRQNEKARPRILWLTDEVPSPHLGGGSIRQFHLLDRISEVADVELVLIGSLDSAHLHHKLLSVHEISRPLPRSPLPKPVRRVQDLTQSIWGRFPSEVALAAPIRDLMQRAIGDTSRFDLVHVEHEYLAPCLVSRGGSRWSITLQNLLSIRSHQLSLISDRRRIRWYHERDAHRARRLERWIVDNYDHAITVSETDASALGRRGAIVPNGVDVVRFAPTPLPSEPRVIFTASFNYAPNVDAAVWYCQEVHPIVRESVPGAVISLVGREPPESVRALTKAPGVEGAFDVPRIEPFLRDARVAVVPVRVGSGTRLKALEAMACGRPIAGTSIGLEGLHLQDGSSAAIADDAPSLAAAVARLCTDDTFAEALCRNARGIAEAEFSWDRIAVRYIDEVVFGARSTGPDQNPRDKRAGSTSA